MPRRSVIFSALKRSVFVGFLATEDFKHKRPNYSRSA